MVSEVAMNYVEPRGFELLTSAVKRGLKVSRWFAAVRKSAQTNPIRKPPHHGCSPLFTSLVVKLLSIN
jgi:hypothetical protein